MSLGDRIAVGQAKKTVAARPIGKRKAASFPKRRYGRIEYELWQIGLPLTDSAFGILRGAKDLASLINLRGTGQPSRETQQEIDSFLRERANKAVTDLKNWLGLRRGRPRNVTKQQTWATGAALRRENPQRWSWAKITQKLDKEGYAENSQQATDRMRMGIQAWEARHARRNEPRP